MFLLSMICMLQYIPPLSHLPETSLKISRTSFLILIFKFVRFEKLQVPFDFVEKKHGHKIIWDTSDFLSNFD